MTDYLPLPRKNRHKIVLQKPKAKSETAQAEKRVKSDSRMSWAKLLNRVFKVDITACRLCRGEVKVVAAIMEKPVIERILKHQF